MEYLLEADHLVKTYGNVSAVDNVSFVIEPGKVYGLLGPNGAGKTTLMKLMTNVIKKTGGEIKNKENLKIAYLVDVPTFYEYMKVEEFLRMLIEINKIEDIEGRLSYLLDLVNLNEHRGKFIKQLSRGLRQKLGIASILVSNVDLLILDEPVSALDPIGRKEIFDIIESLKGKVTIIFSSHILSDIENICDHVILMNKGKVVLDDDCANLMHAGNYLLVKTESREDIVKLKEEYPEAKFSSRLENTIEIAFENLTDTELDVLKKAKKLGVEISLLTIKKETLEDIFVKKVMSRV